MEAFVLSILNLRSISPPPFNLTFVQDECTAAEPVLFLVTPGADPCEELAQFAVQTVGQEHFHEVAMGQGQAEVAIDLLQKCAEKGLCDMQFPSFISFFRYTSLVHKS